ncbi:hypothetical protein D9757_004774 [Collybiopsis confluens]|uniref:Uncharacterized protein n=1 Tax=Collybiopsis confluens TaxID=2823264 RepID=A0A8H5HSZ1_9AGAR|nr:hypothetical protein D9757_004774 [Collybiopsis confluens]
MTSAKSGTNSFTTAAILDLKANFPIMLLMWNPNSGRLYKCHINDKVEGTSTKLLELGRDHRRIDNQYKLNGAMNGFTTCPTCRLTYMTSRGITRELQSNIELTVDQILDGLRSRPSKNPRAHAFLDLYLLVGLTQDNVPGYIHVHHRTKTLIIIDASVPRDEALLPTASWLISIPFVNPLEKNGLPVYWRIPNRSTGGYLTMVLQYYSSIFRAEDELHDLLLWMLAHNRARKLIQSHGPQSTEEDDDDDDENEDETRPKKKVKIGGALDEVEGGGGSGGGAGTGGGSIRGGGKGDKGRGAGRSGGDKGGGRLLRFGAGRGSSTTQNSRIATEMDTGSTLLSKTTGKAIRLFCSPQPLRISNFFRSIGRATT